MVWQQHHTLFFISSIYATGVVLLRGIGDSSMLILQHLFIWSLPFLFLIYRPDERSLRLLLCFIFIVFAVDLVFNLVGSALGRDILHRTLDAREGLFGARMGGLFGHSFYSGSISLAVLTSLAAGRFNRSWLILPLINLALAGSWRLIAAIPLVLLFMVWRNRSRWQEFATILAASLLAVIATVWTSGLNEDSRFEINGANTLRVFAWVTAIEKIQESPWAGVGFPKDNTLTGVDAETIDQSLTAESWYLGAAITYGIPYAVLRLAALMMFFAHHRGNPYARVTVPLILVDMVYGGFFEGTLFYVLLWTQFEGRVETTVARVKTQRQKKMRLNQLPSNVA